MTMNRKKNSVQKLIGFERFTRYGVRTGKADLVFFRVEPSNISVMSPEGVESKIRSLMLLLSLVPDLEIIAADSLEYFDDNKRNLQKRLMQERSEPVRTLLMQDYKFLDEIQSEMASARQFMFALRFAHDNEKQIFSFLNQVEKAVSEHGFTARRMSKPEIKRAIGLYFGTSITGDCIPDIEGADYLMKGLMTDE